MAEVRFQKSEVIQAVAEKIIDEHYPELVDAKPLIGYYIREGNWSKAGSCKKTTAFERHLTGKMYFIVINDSAYQDFGEDQLNALVDHELYHIERDQDNPDIGDSEAWGIRDHDVEEFAAIIKRHGLWEHGVKRFAEACLEADRQLTLADVGASDE